MGDGRPDHACSSIPLRDGNGVLLGALNLGFEELLAERCARVLAQERGT